MPEKSANGPDPPTIRDYFVPQAFDSRAMCGQTAKARNHAGSRPRANLAKFILKKCRTALRAQILNWGEKTGEAKINPKWEAKAQKGADEGEIKKRQGIFDIRGK